MRSLAQRLSVVRPSGTLAMDARARAMGAAGEPVVNLSAGQPDFPTPAHIIEAAAVAAKAGQTRYTDAAGTTELRAAIAAATSARLGLTARADNVLVSAGVKQALYSVLLAVVSEGDEVLVPVPSWGTYLEQVRLAGGVPVPVDCGPETGYQITEAALRAVVTPRTVALIVNSPCNPTGVVASAGALQAVATVAGEHDLLVLSDEIYDRVVYPGVSAISPATLSPAMAERTVVFNGVSKAYAMTGWRIGYAVGPRDLIRGAGTMQEQCTGNACSVSQAAALAALTGPDEPVRRMIDEFAHRRRVGLDALAGWPGATVRPPDGAFYFFVRLAWNQKALTDAGWPQGATGLAEYLLETARVAIVPGEAFGGPGHIRLSFASPEKDLLTGIARIGEALTALSQGETVCRPTTTSA